MYIAIDRLAEGLLETTDYTEITNVVFAPTADLAGAGVPINEFSADIHTTDAIEINDKAALYDGMDHLFAKYRIVYAEEIMAGVVHIIARSDIAIIDRVTLPAVMYSGAALSSVLDSTIVRESPVDGFTIALDYTLDASFANKTVTGFCPEQSARARLTWLCFVAGAYVKDWGNVQIEILPIDTTEALVPIEKTYYKPTANYGDWVTGIKAKTYSFAAGTPDTTDAYVTDANGAHYIVTESSLTLQNQDAPSDAPENLVSIEDVTLINDDNVSGILTRLSQWYFPRMTVDLDAIDNADYIPGDRVTVYLDEEKMARGYIDGASFAFGNQAKAALHLTAAESRASGRLVIEYRYNGKRIGRRKFRFPVDYAYSIENPYIDLTLDKHRYIFRPQNAAATGTVEAGGSTNTQNYDRALVLYKHILRIDSVDSIAATEEHGETIGVIA